MRFLDPHKSEPSQGGKVRRGGKKKILVHVSSSRFKITQKWNKNSLLH